MVLDAPSWYVLAGMLHSNGSITPSVQVLLWLLLVLLLLPLLLFPLSASSSSSISPYQPQEEWCPSRCLCTEVKIPNIIFSSVLWPIGSWGVMRIDPAEILFQSFLQEALVSSFGMGRDVHCWCCLCSIPSADHGVAHHPRWPGLRFGRGYRGVWHASFHLLRAAIRGHCGPTRKWIKHRTQSLVLCC